jgi:hypothetical protein
MAGPNAPARQSPHAKPKPPAIFVHGTTNGVSIPPKKLTYCEMPIPHQPAITPKAKLTVQAASPMSTPSAKIRRNRPFRLKPTDRSTPNSHRAQDGQLPNPLGYFHAQGGEDDKDGGQQGHACGRPRLPTRAGRPHPFLHRRAKFLWSYQQKGRLGRSQPIQPPLPK